MSVLFLSFTSGIAGAGSKVRPATVAGGFYPADPQELVAMIDGFLSRVPIDKVEGRLVALVAPHAGYQYSGEVAAHAYTLLKGRPVERVAVIAPCHVEAFPFSSVYDGDAYATPLGNIPIDKDFAAKLAAASPLIKLSDQGHRLVGGRAEHSLEVQLPFLQKVLGHFKLVPVVMGEQDYNTARALGVSIAKAMRSPDTVIIASSDLSHFHPYNDAVTLDRRLLKAVEEWDYFNLSRNLEMRVWEACGGGPIIAAMIAAERQGANQATLLKYANSGDVTGDRSGVVGYAAVAFLQATTERAAKKDEFSLTATEKKELLEIAKKSVETAVKERRVYSLPTIADENLRQPRGAFVTLKKAGQLRGCIGYITPIKPLCETVRDVAGHAALHDRRFQQVVISELPALEYEISVLSPLRRLTDPKQIRIGRHGLVVKKGEHEGLLLPQVAVEQGWDRMTFLRQTCLKAGLREDDWQDEESDVFTFTAIVFGDHAPPATITSAESEGKKTEAPGMSGRRSTTP